MRVGIVASGPGPIAANKCGGLVVNIQSRLGSLTDMPFCFLVRLQGGSLKGRVTLPALDQPLPHHLREFYIVRLAAFGDDFTRLQSFLQGARFTCPFLSTFVGHIYSRNKVFFTNLTLVLVALFCLLYTTSLHVAPYLTSHETRHLTLLEEAHIGGTTYLYEQHYKRTPQLFFLGI